MCTEKAADGSSEGGTPTIPHCTSVNRDLTTANDWTTRSLVSHTSAPPLHKTPPSPMPIPADPTRRQTQTVWVLHPTTGRDGPRRKYFCLTHSAVPIPPRPQTLNRILVILRRKEPPLYPLEENLQHLRRQLCRSKQITAVLHVTAADFKLYKRRHVWDLSSGQA